MIGATYQVKAVQSLLGSAHSPLIPSVLWSGWLDGAGALVAMTGLSHPNDDTVFAAVDTVTNVTSLDLGVAGVGWSITALGFFDAAAGVLVISADLGTPLTPTEGDPLVISPGSLTVGAA